MPRQRKRRSRKSHAGSAGAMENQIHRIERSLALISPPKVENKLVTVQSVFAVARNVTSAVNDRACTLAISGNGVYQHTNIGSTPNYIGVPQQDQLDLYFKLYKYWTPKRVKITVLPYQPYWSDTGSTLRQVLAQPYYIVKDLDIAMGQTDFTNKAAAKGVKPFTMHGALKDSVTDYGFLDRLAMQKQNKMLFLTNGSWANREQLRAPACLQLSMVDPFVTSAPAGIPFCDVVIELQVMCSDRVDPNDPLMASEAVATIQQQPSTYTQTSAPQEISPAGQIEQLRLKLAEMTSNKVQC